LADIWAAFGTAELAHIVALSLTVSFAATAVAAVVGLPAGAALAICRFPGRRVLSPPCGSRPRLYRTAAVKLLFVLHRVEFTGTFPGHGNPAVEGVRALAGKLAATPQRCNIS
jgi:hypothetical protein